VGGVRAVESGEGKEAMEAQKQVWFSASRGESASVR
jgi:hypothetical protein